MFLAYHPKISSQRKSNRMQQKLHAGQQQPCIGTCCGLTQNKIILQPQPTWKTTLPFQTAASHLWPVNLTIVSAWGYKEMCACCVNYQHLLLFVFTAHCQTTWWASQWLKATGPSWALYLRFTGWRKKKKPQLLHTYITFGCQTHHYKIRMRKGNIGPPSGFDVSKLKCPLQHLSRARTTEMTGKGNDLKEWLSKAQKNGKYRVHDFVYTLTKVLRLS